MRLCNYTLFVVERKKKLLFFLFALSAVKQNESEYLMWSTSCEAYANWYDECLAVHNLK